MDNQHTHLAAPAGFENYKPVKFLDFENEASSPFSSFPRTPSKDLAREFTWTHDNDESHNPPISPTFNNPNRRASLNSPRVITPVSIIGSAQNSNAPALQALQKSFFGTGLSQNSPSSPHNRMVLNLLTKYSFSDTENKSPTFNSFNHVLFGLGIEISDSFPCIVRGVSNVVDANDESVRHQVALGDTLEMVDSVFIDDKRRQDVKRSLLGPYGSICTLSFRSQKDGGLYTLKLKRCWLDQPEICPEPERSIEKSHSHVHIEIEQAMRSPYKDRMQQKVLGDKVSTAWNTSTKFPDRDHTHTLWCDVEEQINFVERKIHQSEVLLKERIASFEMSLQTNLSRSEVRDLECARIKRELKTAVNGIKHLEAINSHLLGQLAQAAKREQELLQMQSLLEQKKGEMKIKDRDRSEAPAEGIRSKENSLVQIKGFKIVQDALHRDLESQRDKALEALSAAQMQIELSASCAERHRNERDKALQTNAGLWDVIKKMESDLRKSAKLESVRISRVSELEHQLSRLVESEANILHKDLLTENAESLSSELTSKCVQLRDLPKEIFAKHQQIVEQTAVTTDLNNKTKQIGLQFSKKNKSRRHDMKESPNLATDACEEVKNPLRKEQHLHAQGLGKLMGTTGQSNCTQENHVVNSFAEALGHRRQNPVASLFAALKCTLT